MPAAVRFHVAIFSLAVFLSAGVTAAQTPSPSDPPQFGPYNILVLADGPGIAKPIADPRDPILSASAAWTISCWFRTADVIAAPEPVAGFGGVGASGERMLIVEAGHVAFETGPQTRISGDATLAPNQWHLLVATSDHGEVRLYADGSLIASGRPPIAEAPPTLQIAPASRGGHLGGQVQLSVLRSALSTTQVQGIFAAQPDFALTIFEDASKAWPLQTRGQAGYRAPQDPSTMPHSRANFSAPVAIHRAAEGPSLVATSQGELTFADGWRMREAPKVNGDGPAISAAGYDAAAWMRATVPGTVLTTMVDDGMYPDPDYGLNNLAIPESLNKQDYWYRNEFTVPPGGLPAGARAELTFEGINYRAQVWLNGKLLGGMEGAFRRGNFDVTSALHRGEKNVLAVRISPPPHPGIPQEQSILGGPGENGGTMELDGPTFLATEGWDWIPAIRDRDSGIWQPVTLRITHALKLGDVQVVSSFHNNDTSRAAIDFSVPVVNLSHEATAATVVANIEQITVRKRVMLQPGDNIVKLTPAEFPQLLLAHPRLWWPNGYGRPELYTAKLSVDAGGQPSDTKQVRFGVREVTYELSLLDSAGHLRRVEFSPTDARGSATPVVDVSHEGMREIPLPEAEAASIPEARRNDSRSHVASLAPGGENSAAIHPLTDLRASPYLVIRVNGVRIAARGGNWGMDDARKRVSRERLEPYFRLNRDAGLNIIRNWVGLSTEENFYELADEYGMMVWNDFWESTENYNIEAQDPALFLANAADTIQHFRNHPSIVMWCGRNEGVPQPIINLGLDDLVRRLDGTRYYSPSSNAVNLQGSGPYRYQEPAQYYTRLNRGFSVETGTPSMSTLESFESTTPKADQWPINDVWAYHDWHASGNGDTHPFIEEITAEFGAPTSLEDFERKAQMLNYVDHRAIFEGMNANLWAPNSGRLLWMTQPAWPSTMWQILSSDYDTQASFYGVKKACEPVHVQLNLATHGVDVVNTTTDPHAGLTVDASVYTLGNALLFHTSQHTDVAADATAPSMALDLAPYLAKGVVLIKLELHDAQGKLLSENLYWLAAHSADYRALDQLSAVRLSVQASSSDAAAMRKVTLKLTNPEKVATLENKLTLVDATGQRILPAYYTDNYVSLLPGESRTVEIEYPAGASHTPAQINLRGWNAVAQTVAVP